MDESAIEAESEDGEEWKRLVENKGERRARAKFIGSHQSRRR